jgi:hypothetical protein
MLHIAVIAGSAIGLYFFWKLCRAVVKWGFFVAYFVTGCLLAWFFQPEMSIGVTLAGGLAFAWTVMAIKSKLWKVIGAAAVVLAMPFFAPTAKVIGEWASKETKPAPQVAPKATAPKREPKGRQVS